MKVKTIKAVEAYRALKTLKVSSMSDEAMLAVWKDLKALRPVSEAYDKDIEEVRVTLQDEEFEKMQQRVTEAEKREIAEINAWFAAWNKKGEEYLKELAEKEVKVDVAEFEVEELLKAFKASDKTFEEVEKLSWLTK